MTFDDPAQMALVACSQAGDEGAFRRLVEPYRAALEVHCYRMLGSVHDAEDLVQETMLRAWNGLESYERRASVRTWLYRIATNACLDELERRPRRPVPVDPFPGDRLDARNGEPISDPAARYAIREGMELALLAAIQLLPGRQRAVLILRDVLGWTAPEVAVLLDSTVTAINSATQRARETIDAEMPQRSHVPATATQTRALLERYVDAWERVDIDALVGLLREDAVLRMPPQAALAGARAIGDFFSALPSGGDIGDMRIEVSEANGVPALVMDRRQADGAYRPHGVLLLDADGERVAGMDAFIGTTYRELFGRAPVA